MPTVLVKAYGALYPAGPEHFEAVSRVLSDWYLEDAASLEGDLLRISHEGEYFPAEELVEALRPLLPPDAEGKLDFLDLEDWSLRRFFFHHGTVSVRQASLNQALESCGR